MTDSNFPSVSNSYDAANVEEVLADFEQELDDEKVLAASLTDSTTPEMIAEAKAFLANNKDTVEAQHKRLLELDSELRQIVEQNKLKVKNAQEYHELVNSQDYKDMAKRLLDIKSVSKSLHSYLVDAGVRGRSL